MTGPGLGDALLGITAPQPPSTARVVKPLGGDELDGAGPDGRGKCEECGAPTKWKNSKRCRECYESKSRSRKRAAPDQQQQPVSEKEAAMPRGVYERKPKGEKKEGDKQKRKYTRRKGGGAEQPELTALAREAFDGAARNLYATVMDQVDIGDNDELRGALRSFEIADKILKAAAGK